MPKILILYHYYTPDDANNSEQCAGLAEGLASLTEPLQLEGSARPNLAPRIGASAQGWEVFVWPCNRESHSGRLASEGVKSFPFPTAAETLKGVKVHRVWRPVLSLHSFWGRIFHSIWMQKAWAWRLLLNPSFKPDVILIGSDPIFSAGLSTFLRILRPKSKIVHWCFALNPEAAVAEGLIGAHNPLVKMLTFGLKRAYRHCDLVVNQGPDMGEKFEKYPVPKNVTLTSWAREEFPAPLPIDVMERRALFGHSPLGLLYSGSMGRSHDFYLTLKLARLTRKSAVFAYGARGSRLAELNKAVNPEDYNVRLVDFAPRERLAARLASADLHIVSLRPEWTGNVVPSKFFGALAVGRPVLFEGDEKSSIAGWIAEYKVGWVLKADNLDEIAEELTGFSENDKKKTALFKRCHEVYQTHFSKNAVIDRWNNELRVLLTEK